MEVNGEYQFLGGPGARLGFRSTNSDPILSTLMFYSLATFEDDLEIVLNDTVKVFAQSSFRTRPLGYSRAALEGRVRSTAGRRDSRIRRNQGEHLRGLTDVSDGTLRLNKTGAVAIRGSTVLGCDVDPLDLNNHSQTLTDSR